MKKRFSTVAACLLAVVIAVCALIAMPASAQEQKLPYVVAADATQADVLEAWATGSYSNIQLSDDLELTLSGETLVVDLAGNDLSVSGSGKVSAFDSANDTYDHTVCGTLTLGGSVTCDATCVAPNGNTYIAWGDSSRVSLHRVNMKITAASLRMSCAGMYYKAIYECDRFMAEKVQSYGVAVSLVDMPGKNFAAAADDLYTALDGADFVSGAVVNSGIVANIMGADWNGEENLANANKKIYARIYVDFGNGPVMPSQGVACSLMDMMNMADGKYSGYTDTVRGQLDDFYNQWKTRDVAWSFVNIGTSTKTIDNSDLVFDADTTNAYCPVCEKKVTWMALTQDYVDTISVTDENGELIDSAIMSETVFESRHYFLAEDLTYADSPVMGFFRGPGGGLTSCLHLNGHDLTTPATTSIFGNSGVLNVMGEGVVTGYSSKATEGAAIRTGNRNAKNGLNIYGGTYKKTDATNASYPVVSFDGAGRGVSIYDGVVIDGGTGLAIFGDSQSGRQKDGFLKLIGSTVYGNIDLADLNTYANNLEFINATVKGTVDVPYGHNLTVSGKIVIDKLALEKGVRLTTKGLEEGTQIGLDADGIFTNKSVSVAGYTDYFVPVNSYKSVLVKDNTLSCRKDYVSDLKFAEGTTDAYCPACDKVVTWTALGQENVDNLGGYGADYGLTLVDGDHYYLPTDIVFSNTAKYAFLSAPSTAGQVACIHLNGYDLTAATCAVFYSGSGILNVMGDGTVAGKATSSYGAVFHSNNKNALSKIQFFSGTYTATVDSVADSAIIRAGANGGRIYFYEDAVVDSGAVNNIAYFPAISGSNSVLSFEGASATGNITVNGPAEGNNVTVTVKFDNAQLDGTLYAVGTNTIELAHKVQIGMLDLAEDSKVVMDSLEDGTKVTVCRPGEFTLENTNAESYAKYFVPGYISDRIVAKDNVLYYKTNYTSNLQIDGNDQAYCPVCMKNVTWTGLSDDSVAFSLAGGHYYLTRDLTFTEDNTSEGASICGGGSGTVSCLHLNGHNITSTLSPALFVSSGYVNVMGSGTVQGYHKSANYGGAVHTNNKNVNNGLSLYSGTYKKYDPDYGNAVIGMQASGATVVVYEDAVIDGEGGLAINIGSNTYRNSILRLRNATIRGDIAMAGAGSASYVSELDSVNGTILGKLTVNGTNTINFAGRTRINALSVAAGSLVGFENMLPGSAINVSAVGIFTTPLADPEGWMEYFTIDAPGETLIVRDNCLYQGVQAEVPAAEQTDIEALLAAYGDRVAKFGDMHNHTDAGPTADGRFSLAEFKERMALLGMSFSTIVDHKQVAHMYHDDWIRESTDGSGIVFVGGSEPAGRVTDGGSGSFHYNMLVDDPEVLMDIVTSTQNFVDRGINESTYAGFNWGYDPDGTQNKNGTYDPTQYSADPDGLLQTWAYPNFTTAEFKTLVKKIYDAGGLLVHVHPKFEGYMDSDNPLDYFFGDDAGSTDAIPMGIEVHTSDRWNYSPSYTPNEAAYQTWVDILEAGKKCYATYGNDNHRLPTADSMTTMYVSANADSGEYMNYMRAGNFAPGWVGVRMQIGDASMGGTTEFAGQRVVFSIGDMYQNEHSDEYVNSTTGEVLATSWNPSYNPNNKYVVQVFDDGGLLMESEIDPGQMNYFAFDADSSAKYYRVVVWDMTQGYRCALGNPIWNSNVTE